MYENNYPNDTYHYDTNQAADSTPQGNAYGNSGYGEYRTGSGMPGGNMSGNTAGNFKESKKSQKKGFGTGKKIAVAICCGVCFGIFAGVGFFAVNTAGNILAGKAGIVIQKNGDTDALQENADQELENAIQEAIPELNQTPATYATVTDVTAVVKEVMPCVVSINNRYVEKMSFWGQVYSSEARSAGSGFIVGQNDTELLLVSNHHVVAETEELTVQFVDGTQAQAQIKGVDEDKDLAVIAVQLDDIEADTMSKISIAKLGDSDSLTVGEPAIAIGNALGYGQSVTTGVVSALDRAIPTSDSQGMDMASVGDTEINTFIQTDAAINPGNSGGALLNMKGEVIGINSNKIGGTTIEGMGYAIPISDVKPIIEKLMSKQILNEENRGYLGITGVDVKADYAELYGVPKGVYVSSVVEGAAADQAGIVRGYIITALNGEEITSMQELKNELSYYSAGETVELTIMKMMFEGYEEDTVSVTLGKQSTVQ